MAAAAEAPGARQGCDPRAIGRAVKRLQRLQAQCGDPRLATSPPSLRTLLPGLARLLRDVAQARAQQPGTGDDAFEGPGGAGHFLAVYLGNLEAKSRQLAALLPREGKAADDQLFQEGTSPRRQLAKLALIFSHMHAELGALFPGGKFCGHLYQLTKPPAHAFWREVCGTRCVVSWAEFQALLATCHLVTSGPMAQALRSTVDITCSGHVSVFEFDIFTRLFQPWPTILRNWQLLAVNHPGYMAFLTYEEAQVRLRECKHKPGSYIFRPSCTRLGQWAIGHVSKDGSILQTIPPNKPLFQVLMEGQKDGHYLYPDGKNHNPDLTELCQTDAHQHIHVSEEQLQLYWAMNSTFELCKICAENDKDVKIEPCGHLLCSHCLASWQLSDSNTCPFCRCEIKGQEPISIHQLPGDSLSADTPRNHCDPGDQERVIPSAPPLPPQLDTPPKRSPNKGPLKVAPPALPKLRAPQPLPRIRSVASVPWEVTSHSRARGQGAQNS